mgnify:CR=1 FL=1
MRWPRRHGTADRRHESIGCRSIRPRDVPDGYRPDQRGVPGGFAGDPDIMDTWATSSLTPQIVCGWEEDPDLFARTFPDGRPPAGARHHPHLAVRHRAADRTASIDSLPWTQRRHVGLGARSRSQEDVEVEGQRRARRWRCSRSTALTAVRYWAASGRPGTDTAFDPEPDEGRPAAGDEAAERVEVRARARR